MMRKLTSLLLGLTLLVAPGYGAAAQPRETLSLNGEWAFDQTEKAFPPRKFTRKIPVP